jgi:hypothetical protein
MRRQAVERAGGDRGRAQRARRGIPIILDCQSRREIAREAARCAETGASLLHLYVRDDHGRHRLDAGRYREAIAAVRRRLDFARRGVIPQRARCGGGAKGFAERR